MGNVANVGAEGDRALPVLDRQPPLPNTAPVRIINREDGDNQERALVPVMPYSEEQSAMFSEESLEYWKSPVVNYQEGQFNMDLNTLMFIAGQARPQMPMAPKRPPNAPLGL